jgi:3',5'-cyclic AMP phosphodiesterase CpdA
MMRKVFEGVHLRIGLICLFVISFIFFQLWNGYASLTIRDWNEKELSRIKVVNPDNFNFAVFGDNKNGYSLFETLLKDINNRKEISFAIDDGDLVPSGKRKHFRRFLRDVQGDLEIPLITAIGNHDLNKGSSDHYQEVFGKTYYSFQIGQNYFIVLDATAESGFNKTERQWLEEELKKAQFSKTCLVFMHVPPFDPRGKEFQKCLSDGKDLLELFKRYKVTHLFASHLHGYFSGVWEGVPYTVTGGAGGRLQGYDPEHFFHHYVAVHVYQGKVETTVKRINAEGAVMGLFDFVEDDGFEWGLLVAAGVLLLTLGPTIKRRVR